MGGLLSSATRVARKIAMPLTGTALALGLAAASASAGKPVASRVLIIGGEVPTVTFALNTAEVWDSSSKSFTATNPTLEARSFHTASVLTTGVDAGDILLTGGFSDANPGPTPLQDAEVYSPSTGPVGGAPIPLNVARAYHTATVLSNGTVLITGGTSGTAASPTVLQSAEIYDPSTGAFNLVHCTINNLDSTDCMTMPRSGHTATLLPNGTVLITGGATQPSHSAPTNSAEIFNPSAIGTTPFTAVSTFMSDEREFGTAITLNNGTILVTGGHSTANNGFNASSADIFDPTTSAFSTTMTSLSTGRQGASAAIVGNGQAMVAGGASSPVIDLFDDTTNTFSSSRGSLSAVHNFATATALNNGDVLIAGGGTTVAEILNSRGSRVTTTGSLSAAREGHTATLIP